MALWPAGSKFTSGKLENVSAIATLTDSTSTVLADQQWGTEYVAFDNPGVECVVTATLSGRTLGRGASATTADTLSVWLQTSFDGGSTWVSGTQLNVNDAPVAATFRSPIAVFMRAQAVPTGQIRVRAMWSPKASGTGQRMQTGQILAYLTGA